MMKIVTANEMKEIDRIAIDVYGIPGLVLMERAGLSVALKIREIYPKKKVVILCGGGNNGGDGLVVSRNLHNWGFDVKVFLSSEPKKMSSDASVQYKIALKSGINIFPINDLLTHYPSLINRHCLIVDAIFGTGLSKPVTGKLSDIFSFINKSGVPVISVDIPSGISSDNGQILGTAIKADHTVTFGLPKRGHLLYPGAEYSGRLYIEDIGFPAALLKSENLMVEMITNKTVSGLIPHRQRYSHKGDYGHVLIIAGSKGKTGAAIMTAHSCMRSGSGLVTLAIPSSLIDVFQCRVTEEMTLPLPDDNGVIKSEALNNIFDFVRLKNIDVIAIGPGIGVTRDTCFIITELIQRSPVPLVIDADGINSLCMSHNSDIRTKILRKAKSPVILTPHTGEMSRLIQKAEDRQETEEEIRTYIEKDRIDAAVSFSKETSSYLVLKGVPTIVAEPEGRAFVNTTGNAGMATAGTGDVLTGIIASLLGQGLNPSEASIVGVYMHGLSGDMAKKEKGEQSLIASDIIDFLSDAFLLSGKKEDDTKPSCF